MADAPGRFGLKSKPVQLSLLKIADLDSTGFAPKSRKPSARFMLPCSSMRKIPGILAPILYIPGLAYEGIMRMRARLYSAGLLSRQRLPGPVISIGNITMGGSGKTPLVIYVARSLLNAGFHPVILSRGYRRSDPRALLTLPPEEIVPSPAAMLGDEPALIHRHVPSAWMGICKDRFLAGRQIAQRQVRAIFLLDDGFQHQKLHRDLDIVVIDRTQPLRANHVFPRGTLREPVSELRRCQVVLINGHVESAGDPLEEEIRTLHPKAMIFHCRQTIHSLVPFTSWKDGDAADGSREPVKSAYLTAALGNPERFRNDILRTGMEVCGARFFADHYPLQRKDWDVCSEEARRRGADAIITTEKDAIKISQPPAFPLLVSVQATELSDAQAFQRILKSCIEEHV